MNHLLLTGITYDGYLWATDYERLNAIEAYNQLIGQPAAPYDDHDNQGEGDGDVEEEELPLRVEDYYHKEAPPPGWKYQR